MPIPTPMTLSYKVTTSVAVGSNAYPGSTTASLVDETVSESDASSLQTTTFTTDSWVGLSTTSTPYTVSVYGTTQKEPSSDNNPVTTTIYGTPQVVDQFPQSSSLSWTNAPAANISYSFADNGNGTRVISSTGTYVDTENILLNGSGGTITTTENGDASGSIAGPLFSGEVAALNFAAPSAGTINITLTLGQELACEINGCNTTLQWDNDPTWFTTPPVFYTETDAITAGVSLPAGCTPNSFGSTANDVNRTINTLDSILGFEETTVFDSYEVNGVPICMTTTDTQNYAYDEQDNQPYTFILVGPLGTETITTTESLVLQSGSAATASAARTTSSVARSGSAPSVLAAVQAHQLNDFAHLRTTRLHASLTAIRAQSIHSLRPLQGVRR
jgi:hypothetical protein